MILEHAVTLKLFSVSNSDDAILLNYPIPALKTICKTIVDTAQTHHAATTKSANALRFAMEGLGACFTLPLNDSTIIKSALKIYAQWLKVAPPKAKPFEQQFICDILSHLSLLFSPAKTETHIDTHTKLINQTLAIISTLVRTRCGELTPATYWHLTSIYLAMCDSILSPAHTPNDVAANVSASMTRLLFEIYIRSVHVVKPDKEEGVAKAAKLWKMLDRFSIRFAHRLTFVEQWAEVTFCLTRDIFIFIAGTASEFQRSPTATIDACIDFSGVGANVKTICSPATLKFMWNKALHLLSNVNRLKFHLDGTPVSPQVNLAAIDAVARMVQVMLKTGAVFSSANLDVSATVSGRFSINAIASPPSINTILDIFGPWLFDAALHTTFGYESGRALAIATIGNIFCTPCRSGRGVSILEAYSTRYIVAIEKALTDEDPEAIAAVLESSKFVLGCNFPGVQLHVKAVNKAITTVLEQDLDSQGDNREHKHTARFRGGADSHVDVPLFGGKDLNKLRGACLSFLASEICLSESQIVIQLLSALMYTEHNPANIQRLLIVMYGVMHVASPSICATFADHITGQLQDTLRQNPPRGWTTQVVLVAFDVLSCMCDLPKKKLPPGRIIASVITYCKAQMLLLRSKDGEGQTQLLIKAALTTLSKWAMANPGVLAVSTNPSSVASDLIKLAWEASCNDSLHEETQAPAVLLHHFIMRRPREVDDCLDERVAIHQLLEKKKSLSSHSEEERKIMYDEYSRKHVRYFLLEVRTLLTVIDDPEEEYLRIICRDATGKYCWRVKCVNDDPADEKNSYVKSVAPPPIDGESGNPSAASPSPLPPPPPPPPVEDPLLKIMNTDAHSDAPDAPELESSEFVKFMARAGSLEGKLHDHQAAKPKLHKRRVSTRHHMSRRQSENSSGFLVDSNRGEFSWRNSRRLLSQIGFMHVDAWGRLEILDGTKQLVSKIVAMDDTPEKDQHIVWIVRAINKAKGDKQQIRIIDHCDFDELAQNKEFSESVATKHYDSFLKSLGDRVDTKSHLKFMDYVDSERVEGEYIYSDSEHEEVLFKVPSLRMKSKRADYVLPQTQVLNASLNLGDDLVNGKKRETTTPVIVLWNDAVQQYQPDSLLWRSYGLTNAQLFIIIDPTEAQGGGGEQLFRVRVYVDPSSLALRDARTLGPLLNGMVLSGKMLGLMVRQTAVNANKIIIDYDRMALAKLRGQGKGNIGGVGMGGGLGLPTSKTAHPFVKRQRILQHIYEDHASDIPTSQFLSMMFRGSFTGRLQSSGRGRGGDGEGLPAVMAGVVETHAGEYEQLVV